MASSSSISKLPPANLLNALAHGQTVFAEAQEVLGTLPRLTDVHRGPALFEEAQRFVLNRDEEKRKKEIQKKEFRDKGKQGPPPVDHNTPTPGVVIGSPHDQSAFWLYTEEYFRLVTQEDLQVLVPSTLDPNSDDALCVPFLGHEQPIDKKHASALKGLKAKEDEDDAAERNTRRGSHKGRGSHTPGQDTLNGSSAVGGSTGSRGGRHTLLDGLSGTEMRTLAQLFNKLATLQQAGTHIPPSSEAAQPIPEELLTDSCMLKEALAQVGRQGNASQDSTDDRSCTAALQQNCGKQQKPVNVAGDMLHPYLQLVLTKPPTVYMLHPTAGHTGTEQDETDEALAVGMSQAGMAPTITTTPAVPLPSSTAPSSPTAEATLQAHSPNAEKHPGVSKEDSAVPPTASTAQDVAAAAAPSAEEDQLQLPASGRASTRNKNNINYSLLAGKREVKFATASVNKVKRKPTKPPPAVRAGAAATRNTSKEEPYANAVTAAVHELIKAGSIDGNEEEQWAQLDSAVDVIALGPDDEVLAELLALQTELVQQMAINRARIAPVIAKVLEDLPRQQQVTDQHKLWEHEIQHYNQRKAEIKRNLKRERREQEKQRQQQAVLGANMSPRKFIRPKKYGEAAGGEGEASIDASQLVDPLAARLDGDEDVLCCICGDGNTEEGNEILYCDRCDIAMHQKCYGISKVPDGDWLCWPCREYEEQQRAQGKRQEDIRPKRWEMAQQGLKASDLPGGSWDVSCCLCPIKHGAFKKTVGGKQWVHMVCALWQPETHVMPEDKAEVVTGISNIKPERLGQECAVCGKSQGAVLRCGTTHCQYSFHPLCGRLAGWYVGSRHHNNNRSTYRAYCEMHSRLQREKDEENAGLAKGAESPPPSSQRPVEEGEDSPFVHVPKRQRTHKDKHKATRDAGQIAAQPPAVVGAGDDAPVPWFPGADLVDEDAAASEERPVRKLKVKFGAVQFSPGQQAAAEQGAANELRPAAAARRHSLAATATGGLPPVRTRPPNHRLAQIAHAISRGPGAATTTAVLTVANLPPVLGLPPLNPAVEGAEASQATLTTTDRGRGRLQSPDGFSPRSTAHNQPLSPAQGKAEGVQSPSNPLQPRLSGRKFTKRSVREQVLGPGKAVAIPDEARVDADAAGAAEALQGLAAAVEVQPTPLRPVRAARAARRPTATLAGAEGTAAPELSGTPDEAATSPGRQREVTGQQGPNANEATTSALHGARADPIHSSRKAASIADHQLLDRHAGEAAGPQAETVSAPSLEGTHQTRQRRHPAPTLVQPEPSRRGRGLQAPLEADKVGEAAREADTAHLLAGQQSDDEFVETTGGNRRKGLRHTAQVSHQKQAEDLTQQELPPGTSAPVASSGAAVQPQGDTSAAKEGSQLGAEDDEPLIARARKRGKPAATASTDRATRGRKPAAPDSAAAAVPSHSQPTASTGAAGTVAAAEGEATIPPPANPQKDSSRGEAGPAQGDKLVDSGAIQAADSVAAGKQKGPHAGRKHAAGKHKHAATVAAEEAVPAEKPLSTDGAGADASVLAGVAAATAEPGVQAERSTAAGEAQEASHMDNAEPAANSAPQPAPTTKERSATDKQRVFPAAVPRRAAAAAAAAAITATSKSAKHAEDEAQRTRNSALLGERAAELHLLAEKEQELYLLEGVRYDDENIRDLATKIKQREKHKLQSVRLLAEQVQHRLTAPEELLAALQEVAAPKRPTSDWPFSQAEIIECTQWYATQQGAELAQDRRNQQQAAKKPQASQAAAPPAAPDQVKPSAPPVSPRAAKLVTPGSPRSAGVGRKPASPVGSPRRPLASPVGSPKRPIVSPVGSPKRPLASPVGSPKAMPRVTPRQAADLDTNVSPRHVPSPTARVQPRGTGGRAATVSPRAVGDGQGHVSPRGLVTALKPASPRGILQRHLAASPKGSAGTSKLPSPQHTGRLTKLAKPRAGAAAVRQRGPDGRLQPILRSPARDQKPTVAVQEPAGSPKQVPVSRADDQNKAGPSRQKPEPLKGRSLKPVPLASKRKRQLIEEKGGEDSDDIALGAAAAKLLAQKQQDASAVTSNAASPAQPVKHKKAKLAEGTAVPRRKQLPQDSDDIALGVAAAAKRRHQQDSDDVALGAAAAAAKHRQQQQQEAHSQPPAEKHTDGNEQTEPATKKRKKATGRAVKVKTEHMAEAGPSGAHRAAERGAGSDNESDIFASDYDDDKDIVAAVRRASTDGGPAGSQLYGGIAGASSHPSTQHAAASSQRRAAGQAQADDGATATSQQHTAAQTAAVPASSGASLQEPPAASNLKRTSSDASQHHQTAAASAKQPNMDAGASGSQPNLGLPPRPPPSKPGGKAGKLAKAAAKAAAAAAAGAGSSIGDDTAQQPATDSVQEIGGNVQSHQAPCITDAQPTAEPSTSAAGPSNALLQAVPQASQTAEAHAGAEHNSEAAVAGDGKGARNVAPESSGGLAGKSGTRSSSGGAGGRVTRSTSSSGKAGAATDSATAGKEAGRSESEVHRVMLSRKEAEEKAKQVASLGIRLKPVGEDGHTAASSQGNVKTRSSSKNSG